MGMQLDLAFLGHRPRALKDLVEAPRRRTGLLANLFDELGHVVDLFDRNHMQLGIVLARDRERQRQGVERRFGAVIGVQDLAEHRTPPASFGFSATCGGAVTWRRPRMPVPALISAAGDAANRTHWR